MSEQERKTVLDALEYVKNVLEALPATNIAHCEMKVAAYKNTEIVIGALGKAWNDEEAEEPQEV